MLKKKRKRNSVKLFAFSLIAISFLILIYIDFNKENFYFKRDDNTELKATIKYQSDNRVTFRTFRNNILMSSKDGFKCFSDRGIELWNETFTFSVPTMYSAGNITAVTEPRGHVAYIFNEKGKLYSISTEEPILKLFVNKSAYLVAILDKSDGYLINVYNEIGACVWQRVVQEENIFPLDCAITEDGRILAISFIDMTDVEIISKILFFYINSDESKEFTDSMFSGFNRMDQITPEINFADDGKLICVSDKEIFATNNNLYDEIIWSIPISNKIDKISFDSSRYIILALGESIPGKNDAYPAGTVLWIDFNGEIVNKFELKRSVTHLYYANNMTIIGTDRNFVCINSNGKQLWQYRVTQDVNDIFPFNSNYKILLVTKNEAQILSLGKSSFQPALDVTNEGSVVDDANYNDTNDTDSLN